MKTKPMKQQVEALRRMTHRTAFGLLMEQGTGKTWTLLADVERLYAAGIIEGFLVIAPKGVHTNWINREMPMHMDAANVIARAWRSSPGKKALAHIEEVFALRETGAAAPLRALAINIDAVITKAGFDMAKRFLMTFNAMIIVDESHRIKNMHAACTAAAFKLRALAKIARIATGTPVTNRPVDIFAQMEFLESGLLGTTSVKAFEAEYSELIPKDHPMMRSLIQRNPKAAFAQITAKNPDGSIKTKNLDKLQALLAPHTFRVLKSQCLDLPPKIFKIITFDLDSAQRAVYDRMASEFRLQLPDDTIMTVKELAALQKLQQITSGFVIPPRSYGDIEPVYLNEQKNPRLTALLDLMTDAGGPFIIWAKFREEIRHLAEALAGAGYRVVEYHGDVDQNDREAAINSFQSRSADVFLAQPRSGGTGLTLTAAETVIYYSNDFNLGTRLQSEDRAHRIGTVRNVVYIDLVAVDTIDEKIASTLQNKQFVSEKILGDNLHRRPVRSDKPRMKKGS
jgi:SNF2 family DNA or RNA helicase